MFLRTGSGDTWGNFLLIFSTLKVICRPGMRLVFPVLEINSNEAQLNCTICLSARIALISCASFCPGLFQLRRNRLAMERNGTASPGYFVCSEFSSDSNASASARSFVLPDALFFRIRSAIDGICTSIPSIFTDRDRLYVSSNRSPDAAVMRSIRLGATPI